MMLNRRAVCIIEIHIDDNEQDSLLKAINKTGSLDFKLSKDDRELILYRFDDDFEPTPFLHFDLEKSTVELLDRLLKSCSKGLATSVENNVLSFKSEITDTESIYMSYVKSRSDLGLAQDLEADDEEVDLGEDEFLLNPLNLDVFGFEIKSESNEIDLNNFSNHYPNGISEFDALFGGKSEKKRRIRRKRGRR